MNFLSRQLVPDLSLVMLFVALTGMSFTSCVDQEPELIPVIFDTDANNEVDDQHALAYLLFSDDVFDLVGVTVNATSVPGKMDEKSGIEGHYREAERVLSLCGGMETRIPLETGADGSFVEIRDHLEREKFDGHAAVNFIIEESMRSRRTPLVLLAVGKLTNIALALQKEPAIAGKVRIVWLGSNYPAPGEHNLQWDVEAMNYILDREVPFEMVTVRYGEPSGTSAVMFSQKEMLQRMPGVGPVVDQPVTGRSGGTFTSFGDYSVSLFNSIPMWGDPPGRALFDMAAVAVVKNSRWAQARELPAPVYSNNAWVERPGNPRKIILWEWFDVDAIRNNFFQTMENYRLAETR